jgi:hypothetical protein
MDSALETASKELAITIDAAPSMPGGSTVKAGAATGSFK